MQKEQILHKKNHIPLGPKVNLFFFGSERQISKVKK